MAPEAVAAARFPAAPGGNPAHWWRGRIGSILAVIGIAAGSATCGAADSEGDDRRGTAVTVDTLAGVEEWRYAEAGGSLLEWKGDTVAVIGMAYGAPEYQLGPTTGDLVAGDATGRVLIGDPQSARILEYDSLGAHLRTRGREGEGPGELRSMAGLAVGAGDTVWVNDLGNRRLTGYPPDGGAPRTVPYPAGDVFPGPRIATYPGGFLQVMGAVGPPGEPVPMPLVRHDRSLRRLDTLWTAATEPIDIASLEAGGRTFMAGQPQQLWPAFHWRGLPDGGAVVSDSADYTLRLISPDGRVRRVLRREPPARPTTEIDREAVRSFLRREAEEGRGLPFDPAGFTPGDRARLTERWLASLTFAERVPRIVALQVDGRSRIWVGVSEDEPGTVQRIDVYEPAGRLVGTLRGLPFPTAFAGRDRILVLDADELGVPRVAVIRIPGLALP